MSANSPLFSIVIPTRNRAHLLPYALQSAINQTFDDYEIVVVANDCSDNTKEVVNNFKNSKVRYHETDTMLTMPDNWDYSWTKSQGKYVTFLPDDDALTPTALETLAQHALHDNPPIVSWEDAPYYYPDWHDEQMRNLLLLFFHGNALVEDVPSELYRRQCAEFSFKWTSPLPKLLNCIAERETLESWREKLGRLFFPIAPDYAFAWVATHIFPSIRVLHRPLSVRGISDHSIGSNAGLGSSGSTFLKEFKKFSFFDQSITDVPTSINHIAATFIRANHALRQCGIAIEPLNHSKLLIAISSQLREKESEELLPDRSKYLSGMLEAASSISASTRRVVEEILTQPSASASTDTEGIRIVRDRTVHMAQRYPASISEASQENLGDEHCARCVLGIEKGLLASRDWNSLYILTDELNIHDPCAASIIVDQYYDVLQKCHSKSKYALQQQAIQERHQEQTHYGQETEVSLLANILRKIHNKSVIDVGSEKGNIIRALLDADATDVYAFEPFPANVRGLFEGYGHLPNVHIFDMALGLSDSETVLHVVEDKTGQLTDSYHSLVSFDETETLRIVDTIRVQCRSLESLNSEKLIPESVGILKIDTERSDFDVLKGIGELHSDIIMIEYWRDLPDTVGRSTYSLSEISDFLIMKGFSNVVVVSRYDQFETIRLNDTNVRDGEWGNAIFIHDAVFDEVAPLVHAAVNAGWLRLTAKAELFADEARKRLVVIGDLEHRVETVQRKSEEQRVEIETVQNAAEERLVLLEQAQREAEERQRAADEAREAAKDARQAAEERQRLLEEARQAAEEARQAAEEARQATEEARQAAEERLRLVQEIQQAADERLRLMQEAQRTARRLQRALDREAGQIVTTRLTSLHEQEQAIEAYLSTSRDDGLWRWVPQQLGVLYQHDPVPFHVPEHYLDVIPLATYPTISMVTPCLNSARFLPLTMDSILDQEYPSLEYVIQDGASTDETLGILDGYGDRLMHVASEQDSGMAQAINRGFTHTSGEIMAYLNADDLLLPGALHYIGAYFARHPEVDVIYSHRVVIDAANAEVGRWILPSHDDAVLSWVDYVPQETLFWRRSIWDKAGGAMDESFRFALDWDLLLRFRSAGARFARLPRFLGAFRVHAEQKTSRELRGLGFDEMDRLREREVGRQVTGEEVRLYIREYIRRHKLYHKLYRLGVLRY